MEVAEAPVREAGNSNEPRLPADFGQLSYSQQYNHLFSSMPLDVRKPVPKPSPDAQRVRWLWHHLAQLVPSSCKSCRLRHDALCVASIRLIFNVCTLQVEPDAKPVLLSDVAATQKRNRFLDRTWNGTDYVYIAFMTVMHGLCLLAPATFSWPMVGLFFASYFVTGCLGITLSFHRQLSHRAFATPKWLEYVFAYCGVLAVQVCPFLPSYVPQHIFDPLETEDRAQVSSLQLVLYTMFSS